jgi:hypothetical protein
LEIDRIDGWSWIELNLTDSDEDRVPDYADGYGWDSAPQFAQSENNHLPLLSFTLNTGMQFPNAQVRFTYDANDPLLGIDYHRLPDGTAAGFNVIDDGHLRLWNLPGTSTRVGESPHLNPSGNFLDSGQIYTLSQLGTPILGQYALFVEAVLPSQAKHDLSIEIAFDLYGTGDFTLTREVEITAVGTRDGWHNQALDRAMIDPAEWNPNAGIQDQEPIIRNVYDYYQRTFLKDSSKLLWAGLARMAGGPVMDGLGVLRRHILVHSQPEGSSVILIAAGKMAADMLRMNKAVFDDMAWQHEAFLIGGVNTLELLADYSQQQQIDLANLAAWQSIATGNAQGIAAANHDLLFREQWVVLQPLWNDVGFHTGIPIGWMARSPLPNGVSFADFTGAIFESIADFNTRWPWLRDDMLPKWLAFTDAQRRDLAISPIGSQMGDP